MPRTRLIIDENGDLARSLGMTHSSHVLVVDRVGQSQFSGGMTSSRLHSFASPGAAAAEDVANGRVPAIRTTDVFGCELVGAEGPGSENRK
jgi:hypothetical protein